MTNRHRMRLIGACLGLLLFAGAAFYLRSVPLNTRLLNARARRVCPVAPGAHAPCFWISNQEAILLTYQATGNRFEFTRLNAATGAETPLTALNRKYAHLMQSLTSSSQVVTGTRAFVNHIPPTCAVSHDGRWLLLFLGPPSGILAATLDGSQERRFPNSSLLEASLIWQDDNRHWIETGLPDGAYNSPARAEATTIQYDIDHPGSGRPLARITPPRAPYPVPMAQNGTGELLDVSWTLGGPTNGVHSLPTSVTVSAQNLQAKSLALHDTPVALPAPGQVYGAAVSPRGDRIAWLLLYDLTPPASVQLFGRLFPFLRANREPKLSLWVSDRNGSHMTEVGHVPAFEKHPAGWYGDFPITQVQWLPDGKQLSYLYHDALYTVDAP